MFCIEINKYLRTRNFLFHISFEFRKCRFSWHFVSLLCCLVFFQTFEDLKVVRRRKFPAKAVVRTASAASKVEVPARKKRLPRSSSCPIKDNQEKPFHKAVFFLSHEEFSESCVWNHNLFRIHKHLGVIDKEFK